MHRTLYSPDIHIYFKYFKYFIYLNIGFKYLFSIFSLQICQILPFSYDSCCSFVNTFIIFFLKLIIFIACSLKDSQNFFIQSLDIEKPDGICSLTTVVDESPGLFLHPSVFSIIHSRSALIINGALSNLCY